MKTLIDIVIECANKPRVLWTPAEEFAELVLIMIILAVVVGISLLYAWIKLMIDNHKNK